jgi:nitrogen regulatory protein P-II 1
MKSQHVTYLTDAMIITAVVSTGKADSILKAVRDVGAFGGIVHVARGTGVRERLGLLGIAVEAEKEVLSVIVPADHQDFIVEAIYNAGELGSPGNGYLYVSALERVATYIPEEALARMERARL